MEVEVFDRNSTSDPIISAAAYNLVIGLTLAWGFALNWFMVTNIDPASIANITRGCFLSAILRPVFLVFICSVNPITPWLVLLVTTLLLCHLASLSIWWSVVMMQSWSRKRLELPV